MSEGSPITDAGLDCSISNINYVFRRKDRTPWFNTKNKFRKMTAYNFSYILEGDYITFTDNRKFEIKAGEGMLIKKGNYNYSRYQSLPFEYIAVEFEVSDDGALLGFEDHYRPENPQKLESIMMKIYEISLSQDVLKNLLLKSAVYELLACLASEKFKIRENYNYKKIKSSVRYIEENCLKKYIDVSELAAISDMSVSQYNRVFKSVFETTPTKYMNIQRINRAKQLLSGTNYPVGDIAEMCGFSNCYYFSKMFKSFTGFSPLGYRAENN